MQGYNVEHMSSSSCTVFVQSQKRLGEIRDCSETTQVPNGRNRKPKAEQGRLGSVINPMHQIRSLQGDTLFDDIPVLLIVGCQSDEPRVEMKSPRVDSV